MVIRENILNILHVRKHYFFVTRRIVSYLSKENLCLELRSAIDNFQLFNSHIEICTYNINHGKRDCYVLICSSGIFDIVHRWIRVCMKRLENWWLSVSEICLVPVPYIFPVHFLIRFLMFHLLFPQFLWLFPMFSLVFFPVSYFRFYGMEITTKFIHLNLILHPRRYQAANLQQLKPTKNSWRQTTLQVKI